MEHTIQEVSQESALALRQAVLRPTQSLDELRNEDSERLAVTCFGAVAHNGDLLSSGTVFLEDPDNEIKGQIGREGPFWRLRSMATRPDLQGRGIGRSVLTACCDHAHRNGGKVIWCAARVKAISFYEGDGFVTIGDLFTQIGGEHIVMWRTLSDRISPTL